jgi:hypothetical protein
VALKNVKLKDEWDEIRQRRKEAEKMKAQHEAQALEIQDAIDAIEAEHKSLQRLDEENRILQDSLGALETKKKSLQNPEGEKQVRS